MSDLSYQEAVRVVRLAGLSEERNPEVVARLMGVTRHGALIHGARNWAEAAKQDPKFNGARHWVTRLADALEGIGGAGS